MSVLSRKEPVGRRMDAYLIKRVSGIAVNVAKNKGGKAIEKYL